MMVNPDVDGYTKNPH